MDTWIVWIQIKILPTPLTWILSQTTPYKILLRHLGNSDYKLYIREYEENSLSFVRCANTIVILYRKMTTFLETHNKVLGMKCHSGSGLLSDISVGGREKRMHRANIVKAWNYWWIDNSSLYYSSTFENVRVFHNYFFKTWLPFDDLHKAQNSTLNTEDWAKLCWEYPSGSERLTRLSSKVCPRLPLHPAAFLHICSNPAIPQTHLVPQRDHAPSCSPQAFAFSTPLPGGFLPSPASMPSIHLVYLQNAVQVSSLPWGLPWHHLLCRMDGPSLVLPLCLSTWLLQYVSQGTGIIYLHVWFPHQAKLFLRKRDFSFISISGDWHRVLHMVSAK